MMHYHMNFEIESKKQYLNLIMMHYRPTCERDWSMSRTVVELDWLSSRHFQVHSNHWSIRQSKLEEREIDRSFQLEKILRATVLLDCREDDGVAYSSISR